MVTAEEMAEKVGEALGYKYSPSKGCWYMPYEDGLTRACDSYRWDPATNLLADEPARHAEVYVFCLFATEDRDTADPLDLSQWTFFVLPTATLDTQVSEQATIGLNPLRALGAVEVPFDGIRNAVSRAAMEGRG